MEREIKSRQEHGRTSTKEGVQRCSNREYVICHHSGLVMTVSTTVPGGGLDSWPLISANMRLLILFFTTTTENLGLRREWLEWSRVPRSKRGGREGLGGWGRSVHCTQNAGTLLIIDSNVC